MNSLQTFTNEWCQNIATATAAVQQHQHNKLLNECTTALKTVFVFMKRACDGKPTAVYFNWSHIIGRQQTFFFPHFWTHFLLARKLASTLFSKPIIINKSFLHFLYPKTCTFFFRSIYYHYVRLIWLRWKHSRILNRGCEWEGNKWLSLELIILKSKL